VASAEGIDEIITVFRDAMKKDQPERFQACQRIVELANQSKAFQDTFNAYDVDHVMDNAIHSKVDPNDVRAVTDRLNHSLLRKMHYFFFYPLYNTFRFPDNYQIGFCQARDYDHLPESVKQTLRMSWEFSFRNNQGYFDKLEYYLENRKSSLFLQTEVEASGKFKATEKAAGLVDRSLDVLRMVYEQDVTASEYCLDIRELDWTGTGGYYHGSNDPMTWSSRTYAKRFDSVVPVLNEILTNRLHKDQGILQKKLRNAIRLYGVATSARYREVRFILLCSALEALVLTRDDRDYLGWKLAERIAFLIAKPDDRQSISSYITYAYSKRSRIVHQDKDKEENVSDEDVRKLADVMLKTFWKLVELKKHGFTSLQKMSNEKSVIALIEKLKFGNPSDISTSAKGVS
jgi:hypothetical protein